MPPAPAAAIESIRRVVAACEMVDSPDAVFHARVIEVLSEAVTRGEIQNSFLKTLDEVEDT